ncbi:hypothetical protein [Geodermatophilus sp. URMC 65]
MPDDSRVPEVLGDGASGVDLFTVALHARDPAGVVPLFGYEVQFMSGDVPALLVRRGGEESDRRQEPARAPAAAGVSTSARRSVTRGVSSAAGP